MNWGWKNVLVSLAMIAMLAPACRAQISPAAGADANSPGGPPSPMSEKDIWKVDPISGALSVNIPFPTTPVGGRGPRIPFGLLYNSSSTFVFEGLGIYSSGGETEGGGYDCDEQGNCYYDPNEGTFTTPTISTMVYEWAPPIYGPTSGPTGAGGSPFFFLLATTALGALPCPAVGQGGLPQKPAQVLAGCPSSRWGS